MAFKVLDLPALAAAREVLQNHAEMVKGGNFLSEDPFWHFVMENAPNSLYQGYKISLYGLVSLSCALQRAW